MSHRSRSRSTHYLTATRRTESNETDEYGQPLPGTDETVIQDEPVQYRPNGTSFVRAESGERVERNPTVKGRGTLAFELQEGDSITLTPLEDSGSEISGLEVVGIDPQYGRRKHPDHTIVELEAV